MTHNIYNEDNNIFKTMSIPNEFDIHYNRYHTFVSLFIDTLKPIID